MAVRVVGLQQEIRFIPPGLSVESVLQVVAFYRRDGAWKLDAFGQGYRDGLAAFAATHGIDVEDPRAPVPRPSVLHPRRVLPHDRRVARRGAHAHTLVLDAMEMARWSRGTRLDGLRCHCDAGSRFMSVCDGERLAEIGAVPSIGGVGDSFDNALAETVNGYCKSELIRGPAGDQPGKTLAEVELATLGWVHWAQHHVSARLPRCSATGRVRAGVLRCPTGRRRSGRNPMRRDSIRPRASQLSPHWAPRSRPRRGYGDVARPENPGRSRQGRGRRAAAARQ